MAPTIYYAAACQTDLPHATHRDAMEGNTDRMLDLVDSAVVGYRPFHDVRLVVFPEFAHAAPIYETSEELADKLAIPFENNHIERLAERAQRHSIYIQSGSFLELDPKYPDAVFNTTCLIGPEGVVGKYRKTHPWIPWEVHASPFDFEDYPDDPLPVFETEIGRLAVATCYDWLFPEVTRIYADKGAEVLIRISAYMDPWGATPPMDWWTVINRARAIENCAYVVASNQGASLKNYPPFSWPGGSMLVDYDGRVIAEASPGPGERIVVGPISIPNLRFERERRIGHDVRSHRRVDSLGSARYPACPAHERNVTQQTERIRRAKP